MMVGTRQQTHIRCYDDTRDIINQMSIERGVSVPELLDAAFTDDYRRGGAMVLYQSLERLPVNSKPLKNKKTNRMR